MTNYKLIESIREAEGLGVLEFLQITGITKGAYYAIRDGRTKNVSYKTIAKMKEHWPNHDYSLFNTFLEHGEDPQDYQEILNSIPASEILVHLSENRENRFENEPLFVALKTILNQEYEIDILKKKYESL